MRWDEPQPTAERQRRRSFKQWLRDYLNKDDNKLIGISSGSEPQRHIFNKSYEGWTLKIHKASGGHIIECWKYEEKAYTTNIGSSNQYHELFMVRDDQDMGEQLNDILVQLMLRG